MSISGGALSNPLVGLSAEGDSQTAANYVTLAQKWVTLVGAGLSLRTFNDGKTSAKTGWAMGEDRTLTPASTYAPPEQWGYRKTKYAVICFGLNDSSTSYNPLGYAFTREERFEYFGSQQTRLVQFCWDRDIIPILLTNPQYPASYTDYVQRNIDTLYYDDWKRGFVESTPGVYLIDTWIAFSNSNLAGVTNWFQGALDLHFNVLGNQIQATWIINSFLAQGLQNL